MLSVNGTPRHQFLETSSGNYNLLHDFQARYKQIILRHLCHIGYSAPGREKVFELNPIAMNRIDGGIFKRLDMATIPYVFSPDSKTPVLISTG
jgi:hypothetical protein